MKARIKQSATVGAAYTEIKMGILHRRATQANIMKVMQRTYKVSVLGLVYEKMALRVSEMEKTEDERVAAATLAQIQAFQHRTLLISRWRMMTPTSKTNCGPRP